MQRIPLEPGQDTIDSCHFVKRPQGGWSMQWRIRPRNGEKPIKVTTQGNATQAELRRRAKAKADEIRKTYGRPRKTSWKPSDDMRRYVLDEVIPDIEAKSDAVLRPRSRKRYAIVLRLYAEAARRYAIADAATEEALTEAFLAIEQGHGTATAKQTQKVVANYVIKPLKSAHVIAVNEAIGLKPEYAGDVRKGHKPVGGRALTREQRLAFIKWLLELDPTCDRGRRGHYTAEQRTAKRKLTIDAALVQASCGLRIVEVRRLKRANVYEKAGLLVLEVTDDASKTRRGRECFIKDARVADRVRERLRALPEGDDVPVFGAPAKPEKTWDASNAQKAMRQLYDEAADALDIPLLREVSSHVWRATLNSEWRDDGVDAKTRAKHFGHSPETNERYYTADIDVVKLAAMVRG